MTQKIFLTDIADSSENEGKVLRYLNGEITWYQEPWYLQGDIAGYAVNTSGSGEISKVPFASGTGTCVGTISPSVSCIRSGHSSKCNGHGYTAGGGSPGACTACIFKYPFSNESTCTAVGGLSAARQIGGGNSSETDAYSGSARLDKFPFASDTNATCIGTDCNVKSVGGTSSPENGYIFGGYPPSPINLYSNIIRKFPFASDTNATCIGILTNSTGHGYGANSETKSYGLGLGPANSQAQTCINTWPHASDGNAVAHPAALNTCRRWAGGFMSTAAGYIAGGNTHIPTVTAVCSIENFPFASDTTITCVGDVAVCSTFVATQMV